MLANNAYNRGLYIALVYLVFGFGWILITDYLLETSTGNTFGTMQTYKGLFFVLCSSLVIFLLTYWMHQKLHRDQAHSKTLFSHSKLAFLTCDKSGRIQNSSDSVSQVLGYSPRELREMNLLDLVPERQNLPEHVINNGHQAETKNDFEHSGKFIHKNGFLIPVNIKGSVERDRAGKVQYSSFVIEDLREAVKQEEALRLQERFIEAALLNLPLGVSIHRTDTNESTFINHKFVEIYGWPAEAMTDVDTFFENVYPDPSYRAEMRKRIFDDILSGDPDRMHWSNVKITTQKGEIRYVSAINIPIPDQHLMISTVQDVTEIHLTQLDLLQRKNQLQHLNNELLRSNKELEEFAYVASHDLQEPLRMVSQFTQMLERKFSERMDDDAKRYVDYAVEGAQRMQVMINDLLEYSRVSATKEEMTEVDLNALLDQVEKNMHHRIVHKKVQITREELPAVKGVESLLERLFMNLLDNSIKYNQSEIPEVQITSSQTPGRVQISIADNGIGVAEAFSEKIFVIFQRLHKRDEFEGTGIGLAVCKRIVERHGGEIRLEESQNGMGGATFSLSLPKIEQ